jgi:hypothetical protein
LRIVKFAQSRPPAIPAAARSDRSKSFVRGFALESANRVSPYLPLAVGRLVAVKPNY